MQTERDTVGNTERMGRSVRGMGNVIPKKCRHPPVLLTVSVCVFFVFVVVFFPVRIRGGDEKVSLLRRIHHL